MATTTGGIVPGDESTIHDEPHLEGHRITVQFIRAQVEDRGLDPGVLAERFGLDLADVYRALAYYHDHREEMRAVERQRSAAIQDSEHRTTDPDSLRG